MTELTLRIADSHTHDAYLVVCAWHELDKQLDYQLREMTLHETYEQITASGVYSWTDLLVVRIEPAGPVATYQVGLEIFTTPEDCAAYLKREAR